MYPKRMPPNNVKSKQMGMGLPVALFIITIMSLIAMAVNRLGESSSQAYSQNVLSTRAFYAAESGAQLRAQDVINTIPCACGLNQTYTFDSDITGLSGCNAATTCTSFVANTETYCTVISIGACNSSNAQRTIEVRLK